MNRFLYHKWFYLALAVIAAVNAASGFARWRLDWIRPGWFAFSEMIGSGIVAVMMGALFLNLHSRRWRL